MIMDAPYRGKENQRFVMLGAVEKKECVEQADEQEIKDLRAFGDVVLGLTSEQRGQLLRACGHEKTGRRKPAPG